MLNVSTYASKPRIRFSPRGYKKAKHEWQHGSPSRLIALMQEATYDSTVSGCLVGRRAGFKRRWGLSAYDDQNEADQARTDWFSGLLNRIRLHDLLEEIHKSRLYLYSVIGFEWEVIDGQQIPVSWRSYDMHHFRRKDGPYSPLVIKDGSSTRELPDEALVCSHHKTPLLMPTLRDFILKNHGLESWAAFLETFGEAFIMGKYPPGSPQPFIDQVEAGVQKLGASSRGVAPEGTSLEIHESSRNTGDHNDLVTYADTGISITLLGHGNALKESSGVNVGGQDAPTEVRYHVAKDDMLYIQPFVNRLIKIIGDLNFGDGRYPQFEFDKSKPVSKTEHADIVNMAWNHGLPIHPEEYRKLGLRVDDDQEPLQKEQTSLSQLMD